MWVFRLLSGVADALGDDQPDDDASAHDEGHKKKNQTEAGMGFIHRPI